MTGIFLSYARKDTARIRPLVEALEARGHQVFWDQRIPAGEKWETWIGKLVRQAGCVVVVWSRSSVKSNWVKWEAAEGHKRNRLVPVRLDNVKPPVDFQHIQAADLMNYQPGQPSEQFETLAGDIKAVLERHGTARRPPTKRKAAAPPGRQDVQIGEVSFPKGSGEARAFWDGSTGPRELHVNVAFERPYRKPPKVIAGIRKIDLGDAKANIHRLSVRAENVTELGFHMHFATWKESQVYDAVASWIAVGE